MAQECFGGNDVGGEDGGGESLRNVVLDGDGFVQGVELHCVENGRENLILHEG